MKQEIEGLKHENKGLTIEADRLQRELNHSVATGGSRQAEKELAKKLKKRELECHALWDTIKDMQVAGK
jgi:regulator of replication initiation timing